MGVWPHIPQHVSWSFPSSAEKTQSIEKSSHSAPHCVLVFFNQPIAQPPSRATLLLCQSVLAAVQTDNCFECGEKQLFSSGVKHAGNLNSATVLQLLLQL